LGDASLAEVALKEKILDIGHGLGFPLIKVASLEVVEPSLEHYQNWLERGFAADMNYLKREPARRVSPALSFPQAKSVLMLKVPYTQQVPQAPSEGCVGRVARYAIGLDYHEVIRARLAQYCQVIDSLAGCKLEARAATDDLALYEQALAARHGMGFIGRNTLMIGPKLSGSYFFLAELFLNLELEPDLPYEGTCGACTRCTSACPTGAIVTGNQASTVAGSSSSCATDSASAVTFSNSGVHVGGESSANFDFPSIMHSPSMVDSNLCIAYLTIENKGGIKPSLRSKLGHWVFGCDICQEICPYNNKANEEIWPEFRGDSGVGPYLDLLALLSLPDEAHYRQFVGKSPLRRPKFRGLSRNALVVLGNYLSEGHGESDRIIWSLRQYLEHDREEMLVEHALWALLQGAVAGSGAAKELFEQTVKRDFSVQTKSEIASYFRVT
jgi:epoxyqueuosine reductase